MAVVTAVRPSSTEQRRAAARPAARLRARPIPVAAYPAGVPRWVTFEGRRRRVVAVHEQPAFDPATFPIGASGRRVRVELSGGHQLTLVQDSGAWFEH